MAAPDHFDHVRNITRAAFGEVPARFAPSIASAVDAYNKHRTVIADSPLTDADDPRALTDAAARIIRVVDAVAGDDDVVRGKCLEIVHKMAEARE